MQRRAALVITLLAVSTLALPLAAHAASIPFFGPIIPDTPTSCALGWGAAMEVINNIIRFALTLLIVFIAPLTIAYAGFLLVAYSVNPSGKEQARSLITNLVIGLVIALAAWLIVNLIMVTLTGGGKINGKDWFTLITSGNYNYCLDVSAKPSAAPPVSAAPGAGTGVAVALPFAPLPTNPTCTPAAIMTAGAAGGYQLTQAEANTFSCIAVPESSCNPNAGGATTPNGTLTTATGLFQIVLGINDTCHNLNIAACTQAAQRAGYTVSGSLNCSTAFKGGTVKPGMEDLAAACRAAATNVNCNVAAAACILRADGDYDAWTADPRSFNQQACIRQYSGLTHLQNPFEYVLALFTL